ncbi:CoA pyrophosphatase [Nocardioides humilatus]|uniref:CoA pyrophosphatase n=2 Tax=Nocardioides humilatus TaxID=2607660 RepID=A0A5B1L9Y8_9ACTN|nr:CoA pyrophosphatase [Nocardioides humilatus]
MKALGHTDAAVLVPLFTDAAGDWNVAFTERNRDLRKHAGEISFPGGRRDPGETLLDTALREAEEEVGLPRMEVEIVGALAPVGTFVTGYRVYPFVAVINAGFDWRPQRTEVANVIELSLKDLRRGRRLRPLLGKGLPVPTITFQVDGHLIWGATARMVDQLLRRVAPIL